MAAAYQLVTQFPGSTMQTVLRVADQAYVPFGPANVDYVEYQRWLSAGNEPDPAPEPAAD